MRIRWTNQGEALFSLVHFFLPFSLSFFLFFLFKEGENMRKRSFGNISLFQLLHKPIITIFHPSSSLHLSLSLRLEQEKKKGREKKSGRKKYFSLDFLLIYESRLFEEKKCFERWINLVFKSNWIRFPFDLIVSFNLLSIFLPSFSSFFFLSLSFIVQK